MAQKTEVWFYHLERTSLERVLPDLLQKTLSRGWRAQVRATSEERLEMINTHLWTFRPDSFLPHGTARDGHVGEQPIFLTTDEEIQNHADVLFLVDGASPGDLNKIKRCITIFDGHDEQATGLARAFWKKVKSGGYDVTYWQQAASGKWEKRA